MLFVLWKTWFSKPCLSYVDTLVVARFPDWLTVSLTLLRFEVEKSFVWLQETEKCRCFRLELQCMGGTVGALGAAQLTAADCCESIEEFVMDEYHIRVYQNNQTLFRKI